MVNGPHGACPVHAASNAEEGHNPEAESATAQYQQMVERIVKDQTVNQVAVIQILAKVTVFLYNIMFT